MPDATIQTPTGFAELSKADQVRYLQALWDQISEHAEEIPVPESHLELAEDACAGIRKIRLRLDLRFRLSIGSRRN